MNHYDITIEDIFRIEQEYILYLEGYTIEEISELIERKMNSIYYDLFILLKKIDSKKAEEIKNLNRNYELFSENEKWLNLKLDCYHLFLTRGYTKEQITYLMGISDSNQNELNLSNCIEEEKIKSKKM